VRRNGSTRSGVVSVCCGIGWAFLAIVGIASCGSDEVGLSPAAAPASTESEPTDSTTESAVSASNPGEPVPTDVAMPSGPATIDVAEMTVEPGTTAAPATTTLIRPEVRDCFRTERAEQGCAGLLD